MGDDKSFVCPVCSGEATLAREGLCECSNRWCRHIFQYPLLSACKYDAEYIHSRYDKYNCIPISEIRYKVVDFITGIGETDKILDVGYGNGTFLKLMESKGWDAYGIDVHNVDCGVKEVSYDINLDFLCVTFFDSLEHIPDLSVVEKLKTRYVVVSVPAIPFWFLDHPQDWKHYRPGEHLHYFTCLSLQWLFRGFELVYKGNPEDKVRKDPNLIPNIATFAFFSSCPYSKVSLKDE